MAFASCRHDEKVLESRIIHSDSVAINFFTGDGKVDSVTSVAVIHDSSAISQLVSEITTAKRETKTDCGYDGSIHFFKRDTVIQDIPFRMNAPECMQFVFRKEQKSVALHLSEKAKELLLNIQRKNIR